MLVRNWDHHTKPFIIYSGHEVVNLMLIVEAIFYRVINKFDSNLSMMLISHDLFDLKLFIYSYLQQPGLTYQGESVGF